MLVLPHREGHCLLSDILIFPDRFKTADEVWNAFEQRFGVLFSLLTYRPVFEDYYRQTLQEFLDDNVQYVELRVMLPEVRTKIDADFAHKASKGWNRGRKCHLKKINQSRIFTTALRGGRKNSGPRRSSGYLLQRH